MGGGRNAGGTREERGGNAGGTRGERGRNAGGTREECGGNAGGTRGERGRNAGGTREDGRRIGTLLLGEEEDGEIIRDEHKETSRTE